MKFGFRVPSLKRRIAARTSWKRYVRHSMGIKMPRGYGFLTNPKRALYNKVYRKTTFGIEDIAKLDRRTNRSGTRQTLAVGPTYQPVNNDNPYVMALPSSFMTLVKAPEKFGKDGWAILLIIVGVIGLFSNPILTIVCGGVGGYWLYRILQEPWYKVKDSLRKAKKLLASNKFHEAVPLLQQAMEIEPENTDLHYLLGTALHGAGQYEESIDHLVKYIGASDDIEATLILAYSYYKEKRYKEAIPLLQRFPKEHFYHNLVLLVLGDCFMSLKQYDMAIEVLKQGPVRKTNLDPFLLQLHYLLGIAYKEKGIKASAIRELQRVYVYDMNYRDVQSELERLKV